jgi:hypothetical protein
MKLRLENSVSSPQDLNALIGEVRGYARWFAHNAIKERMKVKRTGPQPVLSPATTTLLGEWGRRVPLSQKGLDELLTTLEEFAATAPQLTITLAAPPTSGLKKTLVAWCRENIAPNVLINFQFNATLLGGMVVRYGSRIFDWSFRRQILETRQNFPEVLRRV